MNPVRAFFLMCTIVSLSLAAFGAELEGNPGGFVQVGTMHEAIGLGQHQGRMDLSDVTDKPGFYGVGALAGLRGELTILDSTPTITVVADNDRPMPQDLHRSQATMLVGQTVHHWSTTNLDVAIGHDRFDVAVTEAAAALGLDTGELFVFVVEGEFTDVRLHVINGACPIHARKKKVDIDPAEEPYMLESDSIVGTLVGIHAIDAVGRLTHPGTRVHVHLVYTDEESGLQVTGHLEQAGLAAGGVLKVPAARLQTEKTASE